MPNVTRLCADDYIRAECDIEIAYLKSYVEEAKKMGLQDEVEIRSNNPRCGTCFSSACQFIIAKKGIDIQNIPKEKFDFIDYKLNPKDPLEFVLKEIGTSFAEQASMSLNSFFAKDLSAWETLYDADPKKALEYYQQIWQQYVKINIDEFKLNQNLGSQLSKESVLDSLILFSLHDMLIPCKKNKKNNGSNAYYVNLSPFLLKSNRCKYQTNYLNDVVSMLKNYISEIITQSEIKIEVLNFQHKTNSNELLIELDI